MADMGTKEASREWEYHREKWRSGVERTRTLGLRKIKRDLRGIPRRIILTFSTEQSNKSVNENAPVDSRRIFSKAIIRTILKKPILSNEEIDDLIEKGLIE